MVRREPLDPADEKDIELRAVNLLSRREHSRVELQRKMELRGFDSKAIARVLDRLAERNWQSDERFTGSYIRHRVMQRQGPNKIRAELALRGISSDAIQCHFEEESVDWFALAKEALQRKFREPAGDDRKEFARRQRFLASRGFTMDHIRSAMNTLENDEVDWDDAIF